MNFSPQRDKSSDPPVSVIVPARNEEDCIGACLESLQGQQGVSFELFVVDDGSSDRTRQIAAEHRATILDPDPLPAGWSGKSNAIVSAVKKARGKWLLLTDADTVHAPDALQSALAEAEKHDAAMLSYSPRQIVTGFRQRALMPVIFSELASTYRPRDICDPAKPAAAANGQFILVRADAYRKVGGHAAIAKTLLEDVALAKLMKSSGYKIRFRMSGNISARMYRNTSAMWEGWTKNLAALFPRTLLLAALRALEFAVIAASAVALLICLGKRELFAAFVAGLVAGAALARFFLRVRRAHFGTWNNILALAGLPIFSILLLRSYIHYRVTRSVTWKGRNYDVKDVTSAAGSDSIHQEAVTASGNK